jgi:hypothetical protein
VGFLASEWLRYGFDAASKWVRLGSFWIRFQAASLCFQDDHSSPLQHVVTANALVAVGF